MDSKIFEHLKKNWLVYAFIVQMIISFSSTNWRLDALEKRTTILEDKQDDTSISLSEIKTRLASIDTNLEYLKVYMIK